VSSELKSRIIIGFLEILLVILADFTNRFLFLILLVVIFVLASLELIKMLRLKIVGKFLFTVTSILVVGILTYLFHKGSFSGIRILIPLYIWWLFAIIPITFYLQKDSEFFTPFYGIYLWIPFTFLFFLRRDFGAINILILFATIWSFDSFSYLLGRKFGKTKIAPLISPNKTWEGTVSGVIIAFIVFFFLNTILSGFSFKWILLGILLPIYGFFGDLFESLLKRRRGLKDSGSILGAHGGILDRFDSLFFAVIAYYPFLLI